MVMITQYAKQKKRHRCTEQTLGLCGEGEGGMFWENSIETSILSRVKQITSTGWMQETCAGTLVRPRGMGWGGRQEERSGWGIHVNPWLIHVNVWQNPLQYCKVISLQLIKINEKKKKTLPILRSPQPLATTFPLPVSMNLAALGRLYKSNHAAFVLLWLAYFI